VTGRRTAGYGPGIGTPFVERVRRRPRDTVRNGLVSPDYRFSAADSATV